MKKKLLLPLLLAGMWATPAAASTYVSAYAGLGLLSNSDAKAPGITVNDYIEYNSGVPFGVAVGFKSDEFRLEGAAGYQTHSLDKVGGLTVTDADLSIWSFMANGYYDISVKDSDVSPYLTAGLGMASVKGTAPGETYVDESVFAWQVGAGIGFRVTKEVVFDIGYRYFKAGDVTDNSGLPDYTVSGSNILAGIRYEF
jgi:opacity protein-like surface antigen